MLWWRPPLSQHLVGEIRAKSIAACAVFVIAVSKVKRHVYSAVIAGPIGLGE